MSIGLTYSEMLELPIGLVFGLLNEKHNQMLENSDEKEDAEVIVGTADMLKGM